MNSGFECDSFRSESIVSGRLGLGAVAPAVTSLSHQPLTRRILTATQQGGVVQDLTDWLPAAIVDSFDLQGCQVELYDANQRTVSLIGGVGAGWSIAKPRAVDQFWELYKPLALGRPLLFSSQELGIENSSVKPLTWLGCPMMYRAELLGNVWLTRPGHKTFNAAELDELQQIVDCCAIFLHQTQLQQTIDAQQTEIYQLRKAKDEFLQLISHELFAPLGNIQLSTQTLERIFKDVSWRQVPKRSTVLKVLSLLGQECRRQKQFVDNLITLMFPEYQKTSEPMLMNFNDWLPSLLRTFEPRLEQESLKLKISTPDEPLLFECDITQLERTMSELITNAIQYTPPKKTVMITVKAIDMAVEIAIANTGVQIPPNHQSHIFEKFYRIPELDQRQYGGSGLGLALVKQLVANLGGTISLKSTKQRTTFTVTLPK